ncbi:MAG TPA: hypothetical protein VFA20_01475 [Myxococcaceae bacterium]|nr:hypothetical protein [Myxococcaceae bacterium]
MPGRAPELGLRFQAEVPLARVCRVVHLRTDEERRRVQPKGGKRTRASRPSTRL